MCFDIKKFTYGVELELADIDTRVELPEGNKWDYNDGTIVNSSGLANDPTKKYVKYGGEINTKPTNTIDEQINEIKKIYDLFGEQLTINYTSNLHIHIHVPGLSNNLDALKKLQRYISKYDTWVYENIDPIPQPDKKLTSDEYKAAKKRAIRRKKSHHWRLPKFAYDKMLNSKTIQEFYEAHAPLNKKTGKPHWGAVCRTGVNLMQLFNETDTIEFRHFTCSYDLFEVKCAIEWCKCFVDAALNTNETPIDILKNNIQFKFPKFQPFNYELDKIFQKTHFLKNSRKVAIENIEELLELNIIKKENIR